MGKTVSLPFNVYNGNPDICKDGFYTGLGPASLLVVIYFIFSQ